MLYFHRDNTLMNINNSNKTISLLSAADNLQKTPVQVANKTNTNYSADSAFQLAINQNTLATYDIKNLDENTKEVLLNIKDVLTSYEHFNKLCELTNQQLAAIHLSNLLTEQYTVTIRKWILPPKLNYFNFNDNKTFFVAPLSYAVNLNNIPVAKVIINNLIKTEKSYYKKFDLLYNLRNTADLYFSACEIILDNSCIDHTYNEQKYSMEKFIFDYLMPMIKNQVDSESYLEKAYFILMRTQSAEVFKLIYQEIISLNQEIAKKELNKIIYNNLMIYHQRFDNSPNCIDKIHFLLTETDFFKSTKYSKHNARYLLAFLAIKEYSIAKKIIEQSPKNLLTTTHWKLCFNEKLVDKISVFEMAIKFLGVEITTFILSVADLKFLINNTEALNCAILNDKNVIATILIKIGFKYKFNFNLTPDQCDKIKTFSYNPFRLSHCSAITLAIKYIQEQTSVEQAKKEMSVYNSYLTKRITHIGKIFTSYYS